VNPQAMFQSTNVADIAFESDGTGSVDFSILCRLFRQRCRQLVCGAACRLEPLLPSVKPVRVVVAGTVRFFIIEFVCEIVEILGRWAAAGSRVRGRRGQAALNARLARSYLVELMIAPGSADHQSGSSGRGVMRLAG
jgi:hypothetical protein